MDDKEKKYLTVDEIMGQHRTKQQKFISDLEKEEGMERLETYELVEAELKGSKENMERKKNAFIQDIKGSLGKDIKNIGGKVTVIVNVDPWYEKLGKAIKKFMMRF